MVYFLLDHTQPFIISTYLKTKNTLLIWYHTKILANNKTEHATQSGSDMDNTSNTTMKNEPELISQPEQDDEKKKEGMNS